MNEDQARKSRRLQPAIPITSKYFKYVPACATDIKKTFEKVREASADDEFVKKMFDFIPPKVTP